MNKRYMDGQVGVLGSLLIDDAAAGRVFHRLRDEDFSGAYRSVFRAMRDVFTEKGVVDVILVAHKLGKEYEKLLREVMEVIPSAANVDLYAEAALEEAQLQRIRDLSESLQTATDLDAARDIIGKINRDLGSRPSMQVVTMAQGIQDFYTRQQTKPEHITWGMIKLDRTVLTEAGDFVVIGGRPSAGKTALSVQIAWAQAKEDRVGYFSLETNPDKLIDRTVAMVTGVNFSKIKRHQLGQDDWQLCSKQAPAMSERKLELIRAGGATVADIQSLALAGQYKIIYIDYLQLITPADSRRSEVDQVSQISKDLHIMAQTTGITVVALSQLSRLETKRIKIVNEEGNKVEVEVELPPTLQTLRQSGQIEQDADAVMLLYLKNSLDPNGPRILQVAKNKEGEARGRLQLAFDGSTQKFTPIETGREAAQQYVDAGKKAKQMNRLHGQTTFTELPPGGEDPWNEEGTDQ